MGGYVHDKCFFRKPHQQSMQYLATTSDLDTRQREFLMLPRMMG